MKFIRVCAGCGTPMKKTIRLVLATQVIEPQYICPRIKRALYKERHEYYNWVKQ